MDFVALRSARRTIHRMSGFQCGFLIDVFVSSSHTSSVPSVSQAQDSTELEAENRLLSATATRFGLRVMPIYGDGNCLFRCLSTWSGGRYSHQELRARVHMHLVCFDDLPSRFIFRV